MMINVFRCSQSTLNGPASIQAMIDDVFGYTKSSCPLNSIQTFAIELYKACPTRVHTLLRKSGPATILRRIRAIIVNSIKRRTVWSFAHISKKTDKAVAPSVAHGYSSVPVVSKLRAVWVVTTGKHGVVGRAKRVLIQTVFGAFGSSQFAGKAPTALTSTIQQIPFAHIVNCSTVTSASPVMDTPNRTDIMRNCPSSKVTANKITGVSFFGIAPSCSSMSANKALGLSFDPSKGAVIDSGNRRWLAASAFTKFGHVSTPLDTQNTYAIAVLYHGSGNQPNAATWPRSH